MYTLLMLPGGPIIGQLTQNRPRKKASCLGNFVVYTVFVDREVHLPGIMEVVLLKSEL
jgi:hypothetical protein